MDSDNLLCPVRFRIAPQYDHLVELQHHWADLFRCYALIENDERPTEKTFFFVSNFTIFTF